MHNNIGILEVNQMQKMSIDDIISLYRQGYRLEEFHTNMDTFPYSLVREYEFMNPATCPTSIVQGTTKTLTMAVTTDGTPPYIPKFYVDGVQKTINATWDSVNKRFTFPWTFSETIVSHTYAAEVTDSCGTGAKTSNRDTCTVAIVSPTPVLTTISVTPTTALVNIGGIVQLTAVCKDTSGVTMTCPSLTWTSDNTAKATVSSSGLVTGMAIGSANITASASGKTSNLSAITVTSPTQVLGSISVTPISQSINIGGVIQLTAVCKDTSGVTMTCPTLTWASSNTAKATVNSSGLVTGVAAGSANITASASGVTSNLSAITVTGIVSTLTSIVISPASASIGIGGTRQLTPVCKDQNGTVMTCPTLTWLSSNTSKATVSSSGLITGIAEGTANVTASASGVTSNLSAITVTTTPPPQEAGGGAIVIAAVALVAAMMFMSKKPPTPPA